MKRNENSGNDIKRNKISGGYGAVNISTSTSVSGIIELLISVKKKIDRVFESKLIYFYVFLSYLYLLICLSIYLSIYLFISFAPIFLNLFRYLIICLYFFILLQMKIMT